eukprot:9170717-Karenia_brevis.AAC.1
MMSSPRVKQGPWPRSWVLHCCFLLLQLEPCTTQSLVMHAHNNLHPPWASCTKEGVLSLLNGPSLPLTVKQCSLGKGSVPAII